MTDRWRGWQNAEIYERFVRERPIYRWLSAELVARAGLDGAHRVLDLGWGTGATTRAALPLLGVALREEARQPVLERAQRGRRLRRLAVPGQIRQPHLVRGREPLRQRQQHVVVQPGAAVQQHEPRPPPQPHA